MDLPNTLAMLLSASSLLLLVPRFQTDRALIRRSRWDAQGIPCNAAARELSRRWKTQPYAVSINRGVVASTHSRP